MDPIGSKAGDMARMLDRLGKALAPRDATAEPARDRSPAMAPPTDLRGELIAMFRDVDTTDALAMRRARSVAIPAIVKHTIAGHGRSDAEMAAAVQALDALFDSDPRLSALLVRAIEAARG